MLNLRAGPRLACANLFKGHVRQFVFSVHDEAISTVRAAALIPLECAVLIKFIAVIFNFIVLVVTFGASVTVRHFPFPPSPFPCAPYPSLPFRREPWLFLPCLPAWRYTRQFLFP